MYVEQIYLLAKSLEVFALHMLDEKSLINRIFSRLTLRNILAYGYDEVYKSFIDRYFSNSDFSSNQAVFTNAYKILSSSYRNEYFYKNTIINKILMGRHSLNTTTALSELPVATSKADLIMINGSSTVYEIKTELDSLDRLESQVKDYYKAFDKVCIVASESHYEKLKNLLSGSNVGISVLTKQTTISPRKPAYSEPSFLETESIFRILRKQEYENILLKHFGWLPDVVPVRYYRECKAMFAQINPIQAHEYMLGELRLRNQTDVNAFKSRVPYELKSLVYFSGFRSSDYIKLNKFLQGGVQNVFSVSEGTSV